MVVIEGLYILVLYYPSGCLSRYELYHPGGGANEEGSRVAYHIVDVAIAKHRDDFAVLFFFVKPPTQGHPQIALHIHKDFIENDLAADGFSQGELQLKGIVLCRIKKNSAGVVVGPEALMLVVQ